MRPAIGRPQPLLLLPIILLSLLFDAPPQLSAQEDAATVRLDGRPLFEVSGTETLDAAERAKRVEQRLRVLLRALETPPSATIEATESPLLMVS